VSTENEGTAGEGTDRPVTRPVPPVPDATPEGTPASAPRDAAYEPQQTQPAAAEAGGQAGGPSAEDPVQAAPPQPPYTPMAPPPPSAPPSAAPGSQYGPPEYGAPAAAHGQPAPGQPGQQGHGQPAAGAWPPPVYPGYGGGAHQGPGGMPNGPAGPGGTGGPGGPGDPSGNHMWGGPEHPRHSGSRRRTGGLIAAVVIGALVAGGIGGGIGYWAAENGNGGVGSTTVSAAGLPKESGNAGGSVTAVAANSLPSVVTIDATSGNGDGDTGTGFVFDKQGHILTNNHVVASGASAGGSLTATFSNGKKYQAKVVGRAEGYDVAVIKLVNGPSNVKPLVLGNSDEVQVGDQTIAIGAPFGLSNTVTTGIISAEHRPVVSGDETGSTSSYMSALQTDASINPGNSGGPLLDARGAVIGINSAIQPGGGGGGGGGLGGGDSQPGSVGLGFAIPINQAAGVAQELIKTGKPVYPIIGAVVTISDNSQTGEGGNGAVISSQGATSGTPAITPGGPADKAGLRSGDVITKFDNVPIDSGPTLISEIWTHKPNDKVTITFERDGKSHTAQVTLGSHTGEEN
jgi:putative serine protease PepD